jgi:hypothetical protein
VAGLISGAGTVRYVPLEGGFYVIQTDDDQQYKPANLPAEFRQDGLMIRFTAHARHDMIGIHMHGTIVELDHIERR